MLRPSHPSRAEASQARATLKAASIEIAHARRRLEALTYMVSNATTLPNRALTCNLCLASIQAVGANLHDLEALHDSLALLLGLPVPPPTPPTRPAGPALPPPDVDLPQMTQDEFWATELRECARYQRRHAA